MPPSLSSEEQKVIVEPKIHTIYWANLRICEICCKPDGTIVLRLSNVRRKFRS